MARGTVLMLALLGGLGGGPALAIDGPETPMVALPEGLVAARQGLAENGRQLWTVERAGGGCWTLHPIVRGSATWQQGQPLAFGGGGRPCGPEVTVAAADGSTGLVYLYDRGIATVARWSEGGLERAGEFAIKGEPGFETPPPAGAALSPDGRYALLGAPHFACKIGVPQQRCGTAALFTQDGAAWRQVAEFEFPEEGPFNIQFGQVVALSRDAQVLAVGGPGVGGDQGEVHLWEKRGAGWAPVGVLVPDERADAFFGSDLAISTDGRTVAVGAERGVYLFTRDGRGWGLATRLAEPMPDLGSFGAAVALSGDGRRLLVGAPRSTCATLPRCGVAFLFERASGDGTRWNVVRELRPPTPRPLIDFAWRLALDGTGATAVVQGDRPYIADLR